MSNTAFASDLTEEKLYFIINDNEIIYYGEDYENAETGEYFRWITNPNAKGEIAKNFEFKIKHSVKSSKFTINSTKVSVESSAKVTDAANDPVSGYNNHPYSVSITGTYSRNLDFSTGGTESGTISGLVNGGSYTVTISNQKSFPSTPEYPVLYLQGSGSITCM